MPPFYGILNRAQAESELSASTHLSSASASNAAWAAGLVPPLLWFYHHSQLCSEQWATAGPCSSQSVCILSQLQKWQTRQINSSSSTRCESFLGDSSKEFRVTILPAFTQIRVRRHHQRPSASSPFSIQKGIMGDAVQEGLQATKYRFAKTTQNVVIQKTLLWCNYNVTFNKHSVGQQGFPGEE